MNQDQQFSDIYFLITSSRDRVFHAINVELIDLYWKIGAYIHQRLETEEWGKSVVEKLSNYLQEKEPELKGFSRQNLWRMRQFYECYAQDEKLSPLVRELTWTNNMVILSRTKSKEEREFYLRYAIKERYSKRELERQINSAAFERMMLSGPKLSPVVRELRPELISAFRDTYALDFLNLPEQHDEKDLQRGIVKNLRQFILELGKDFTFMGEEYRIQVGNSDFFIDLLFYHRGLQCLVALELKIDKFQPEYIGKMNFYLEALDRDIKKEHENPSVGIILCRDKDQQVVEYAMSRNMSPTLVAEYQTKLIDKTTLENKLRQLFQESEALQPEP